MPEGCKRSVSWFDGSVDATCAESERAPPASGKSGLLHQGAHGGTLRHGGNAFGKIGIGTRIFRYQTTDGRNDTPGVEAIERAHQRTGGHRQFDDAEHGSGAHDAVHLAIARQKIGKVAHAVGHGDTVERAVAVRQGQTVGHVKGYTAGESGSGDLAAAYADHAFGKVGTRHPRLRQTPGQEYGQIAGACGNVEDVGGVATAYFPDGIGTPYLVYAHGHGTVHEVIGRSDGVEHLLHLFRLRALWVVWLDPLGRYVAGTHQPLMRLRQSSTLAAMRPVRSPSGAGTNFSPVMCS